uniref:Uncharacterized protein n=1 Tax=Sinocyclocheilus rhinocerous TaxID=307959 RepID=A0A673N9G4_9TELE
MHLPSRTPVLPQVTSLLFCILFLTESLNILNKQPGGEDKKKETKLQCHLQSPPRRENCS